MTPNGVKAAKGGGIAALVLAGGLVVMQLFGGWSMFDLAGGIAKYCEQSEARRLLVRDTVAEIIKPNRIEIHCTKEGLPR